MLLNVEALSDEELDRIGLGYERMPANFSESDCRMALRNMLRGIAAGSRIDTPPDLEAWAQRIAEEVSKADD